MRKALAKPFTKNFYNNQNMNANFHTFAFISKEKTLMIGNLD